MVRETGSVKWFSNEKGYGFIERENGEDVFVHHSDIEGNGFKTLRQGERVEFEIEPAAKGPKARSVVREDNGNGELPAHPEADGARPATSGVGATESRSLAAQLKDRLGRRFFGNDG
jgi:CspA family cold shock protein